jgi:hypothetical protein
VLRFGPVGRRRGSVGRDVLALRALGVELLLPMGVRSWLDLNGGKSFSVFGIVDQFSLFSASHAVSKLAALAQALITLVSVNSPELRKQPEQLTRAP